MSGIRETEAQKERRRARLRNFLNEVGYFELENLTTEPLEEEFKEYNLRFHSAGGVVPVQAEGYVDGKFFYFRFRGDNARLMVGVYGGEKSLPENAETVEIRGYSGEPLNGYLTNEEFQDCFRKLLNMYLQK